MRILYLDCFSGISGDMTLAALIDAGADRAYIERELGKIRLEPFTIQSQRVVKRGISALKIDVVVDAQTPPTHHRHYSEIAEMIDNAGFNDRVTSLSQAIFAKIGAAEAKIHSIPIETVHFHEVGAIDSIVDVIGAALAIDSLGVDRVYCSPVPLGSGTIRIDHGVYPIPAPATLEMMKGLPVAPSPHQCEMTTPTGAGIVSAVVDEFANGLPSMIVEGVGYGAGTRDLPDQPNVLRVIVGLAEPQAQCHTANTKQHADHAHDHHEHSHPHGDPREEQADLPLVRGLVRGGGVKKKNSGPAHDPSHPHEHGSTHRHPDDTGHSHTHEKLKYEH